MSFDQFHLIHRDQVSIAHHEFAADHGEIGAHRVAKNRRCHRVVQRPGIVQAVKIDCKKVGALSRLPGCRYRIFPARLPRRVLPGYKASRAVIRLRDGSFDSEKPVIPSRSLDRSIAWRTSASM